MKKLLFLLYFAYLSASLTFDSDIDVNTLTPDDAIYIKGTGGGFSNSISIAGDINGDGIPDMIIGAPGQNSRGTIYVVFGSDTDLIDNIDLSTTSLSANGLGFKIEGVSAVGGDLGGCVSGLGDVNGDSIDDIVVGSRSAFTEKGVVYVIFGKTSGLIDLDLDTITTLTTGNRGFSVKGPSQPFIIGETVGRLGDINGDGLNDIGFGGTLGNTWRGHAIIVYGSSTNLGDIDMVATPSLSAIGRGIIIKGFYPSMMGSIVTGAGDVNGDGVDDLLCAATGAYSDKGRAYIIYGNSALSDIIFDSTPTLQTGNRGYHITGFTSSKYIMNAGGSLGDINGDGLADFYFNGGDLTWNGRGCILFGSSTLPADKNLATIPSLTTNNEGFCIKGQSGTYGLGRISKIGDINGDGLSDIMFSASKTGANDIFVMYGKTTPFSDITLSDTFSLAPTEGFKITGVPGINFAGSLTYAADINGDGSLDLMIGANQMFTTNGGVYLLFGPRPPPPSPPPPAPPVIPAPVPEVVNLGGLTDAISTASQATFLAATVLTIINFNNPGPVMLITLSEGLLFFKYLKLSYPVRLQFLLDNCEPGSTLFEDLLAMPEAIMEKMTKYDLPEKFEKYGGFHSSFLVNFWPSLVNIAIVAVVAIITWILQPCFNSKVSSSDGAIKKGLYSAYAKTKQAVRWNLMFSMLTDSFSDLSLFTALEFTSAQSNSPWEKASLVISIISNFAGLFVLYQMIMVVLRLQKTKKDANQKREPRIYEKSKKALKGYEVVFDCFKDQSIFQQSLLLFFNIKMYVFYAIIAYIPNSPVVQTSLNSLMGLIMLGYLIISRPFESRMDFVQCIFTELLFEIINICTFIFAVTESAEIDFVNGRILLGDIIIGCNAVFMGVAAVFLLIQALSTLYELLKTIRNKYFSKNGSSSDIESQRDTAVQKRRRLPIVTSQRLSRPYCPEQQQTNILQSSTDFDSSMTNMNTDQEQRRNIRDYGDDRNNRLRLKNNPRTYVSEFEEEAENSSGLSKVTSTQTQNTRKISKGGKTKPKMRSNGNEKEDNGLFRYKWRK